MSKRENLPPFFNHSPLNFLRILWFFRHFVWFWDAIAHPRRFFFKIPAVRLKFCHWAMGNFKKIAVLVKIHHAPPILVKNGPKSAKNARFLAKLVGHHGFWPKLQFSLITQWRVGRTTILPREFWKFFNLAEKWSLFGQIRELRRQKRGEWHKKKGGKITFSELFCYY